MLVTRAEAGDKWCPMGRFAGPNGAENVNSCCQAAACMMWRWVDAPGADEATELARRGYCGLAGQMTPQHRLLYDEPTPEPIIFDLTPEDFNSQADFILAKSLASAGIRAHSLKGDVAVASEPIGLVATIEETSQRDDGAIIIIARIEARVVNPAGGGGLIPLGSYQYGVGTSNEAAIEEAIGRWVEYTLPPLRRAMDESNTERPDGFVTHTDPETQTRNTYAVFNGPINATDALRRNMPSVFSDNPYLWLADKTKIEVAKRPLLLFHFGAQNMPDGTAEYHGSCEGQPLAGAEAGLQLFPWPLPYLMHYMSWHTVLKQVD